MEKNGIQKEGERWIDQGLVLCEVGISERKQEKGSKNVGNELVEEMHS